MAPKKDTKGKMSNGERPNVSRKILNAVRRERDELNPIGKALRTLELRMRVMSNPKGEKERNLREKYIKEENVQHAAIKLYEMYKDVGLKWSAAVQAVKTDYTTQLHEKWQPLLDAAKKK